MAKRVRSRKQQPNRKHIEKKINLKNKKSMDERRKKRK